jgi:hypothetical protein
VLTPKPARSDDFPGETFRVLKENEIKKHGEYRTQLLVLEYYRAWQSGDRAAFDRWVAPQDDHCSSRPRLLAGRIARGLSGD